MTGKYSAPRGGVDAPLRRARAVRALLRADVLPASDFARCHMDKTARTAHASDPEIFAAARHALDTHPGVPATVHVHVDLGELRLTGTVRRAAERSEAERAVRSIAGVRLLINDIEVGTPVSREGFEPPDDRE